MPESDERIAAALLIAIDGGAIHHHDIELAVIVAVEEADSAAHGFDDVIFFARGDVGSGQTGMGGDFAKDGGGIDGFNRGGSRSGLDWGGFLRRDCCGRATGILSHRLRQQQADSN